MNSDITLDALAQQPELVQHLSADTARALRLRARIALAALEETPDSDFRPTPSPAEANDNLVGIKEAARMLDLSVSYLAHKGDTLPFVVHIGRRRLYSMKAIRRYIERQLRT